MDVATFLGMFLGIACLALAAAGGNRAALTAFFDIPSLLLVGGGTLAAVSICLPLSALLNSLRVCRQIFFRRRQDVAGLIGELVSLAETARRQGLLALEKRLPAISDPFLALAVQMAVDGARPELLEDVLRTEMEAVAARHKNGKLVPEQMGRFAPAFGMIGTLLGLIIMLSNMSSPESIGPGMAVAMLTALYGVLAANLFFLPFAEKLGYLSRQELLAMEVVVRGVLAIQAGENPRVIQQKLNTFLPLGRGRMLVRPATLPAAGAEKRDTPMTPQPNTQRRKAA